MHSFLRDRITSTAKQEINFSPTSEIGMFVKTVDVVQYEHETNPWYLAVNGMSQLDADQILQSDAIKTGWSVVARKKGVNRQPRIFVNPKASDIVYGGSSGKTSSTLSGSFAEMTNITSQTPTIIGVSTPTFQEPFSVPLPSDSTSSKIPNEIDKSGSLQGPIAPFNPFGEGVELTPTPAQPQSFKKDIDPKTGSKKPTTYSDKSIQGSRISVGTFMIDPSSINTICEGAYLGN